ncbi:AI-2E family transporter [Halonotius aquaticus]|uniref:AI-2E family transporter n=2 Tax=Halonotius aquaticus TaxID=2216978 RepID=A0A3A6QBE5_9EURY|nr:AI-2E family transporter [Halonotius aquaticus]
MLFLSPVGHVDMALRSVVRDHPLWLLAGIVLLGAIGYVLSSFIGLVVVGLFVYYAARPVYRRLVDRIDHPTVAAGLSIIALVLPAFLLVGYALLIVSRELRRLTNVAALGPQQLGIDPETYSRLTDPSFLLSPEARELVTGELSGSILQSVVSLAETATTLGIILINLLAIVVFAFYLLRDDDRLAGWIHTNFDTRETVFEEFLQAVDRDLSSIFFGNILNAIITGTIAVISYSVLNVFAPAGAAIPAAALVGSLAGAASLIPIVGMKIIYVPVGLYMAVRGVVTTGGESLWFVVLFAIVSVIVVDSIPDFLLRPYVSGKNVHIGSLMLAYILGPLFFGWYGLFLMPALLVVIVQFAVVVVPSLDLGSSSTHDSQPPLQRFSAAVAAEVDSETTATSSTPDADDGSTEADESTTSESAADDESATES